MKGLFKPHYVANQRGIDTMLDRGLVNDRLVDFRIGADRHLVAREPERRRLVAHRGGHLRLDRLRLMRRQERRCGEDQVAQVATPAMVLAVGAMVMVMVLVVAPVMGVMAVDVMGRALATI